MKKIGFREMRDQKIAEKDLTDPEKAENQRVEKAGEKGIRIKIPIRCLKGTFTLK
jgi:hypothetical protein